jgi:SAM-dependent methyltransferase
VTPDCLQWDKINGDATLLTGLQSGAFDWVYSSHCLEHLADPTAALTRWWELVRSGGYLIVLVPDEDLYEQGIWPSSFNQEHKTTWTTWKAPGDSWSPVSRNLRDELQVLPGGELCSLRFLNAGYRWDLHRKVQLSAYVESMEVAKRIEAAQVVDSAALGDASLPLLGFFPIDQSSNPFGAEVSVEGIVRKVM